MDAWRAKALAGKEPGTAGTPAMNATSSATAQKAETMTVDVKAEAKAAGNKTNGAGAAKQTAAKAE